MVTRSSLEREVKSRASQIRQRCQRLATAATFLRKQQCCLGAMTRRWAPQTRYLLQCNTTNIKEKLDLDLIKLNDNRNHMHKKIPRFWEKTVQLSTIKITKYMSIDQSVSKQFRCLIMYFLIISLL